MSPFQDSSFPALGTKNLKISRLAAYWPAPIHAVALLAYTVVTWLPARPAVCYS